jgi:hypothetical protein
VDSRYRPHRAVPRECLPQVHTLLLLPSSPPHPLSHPHTRPDRRIRILFLTPQHSAIAPGSPSADYSLKTALGWFESQYKISNGKGAPKNINTMSPFYSLAAFLLDGSVKDERWLGWCEEWAEWVMNDLPRTQEGGYQHSE